MSTVVFEGVAGADVARALVVDKSLDVTDYYMHSNLERKHVHGVHKFAHFAVQLDDAIAKPGLHLVIVHNQQLYKGVLFFQDAAAFYHVVSNGVLDTDESFQINFILGEFGKNERTVALFIVVDLEDLCW